MTWLGRPNELARTRLEYWTELVSLMRRRNSLIVFNGPSSSHQLRATADALGSGDFTLIALATVRPARIGVGVETIASKGYFSELVKDRDGIEKEIGYEPVRKQVFEWNPETKVNDIWLYWQVDFFERRKWPEQHEWLRAKLETFRKTLRPRVSERNRLRSAPAASA